MQLSTLNFTRQNSNIHIHRMNVKHLDICLVKKKIHNTLESEIVKEQFNTIYKKTKHKIIQDDLNVLCFDKTTFNLDGIFFITANPAVAKEN